VILKQKLTLNRPSLVDEEEETRVLVTVQEREKKSQIISCLDHFTHIKKCN